MNNYREKTRENAIGTEIHDDLGKFRTLEQHSISTENRCSIVTYPIYCQADKHFPQSKRPMTLKTQPESQFTPNDVKSGRASKTCTNPANEYLPILEFQKENWLLHSSSQVLWNDQGGHPSFWNETN
jgi:hypothetical protein